MGYGFGYPYFLFSIRYSVFSISVQGANFALFRLAFTMTPPLSEISLADSVNSPVHSSIGTTSGSAFRVQSAKRKDQNHNSKLKAIRKYKF